MATLANIRRSITSMSLDEQLQLHAAVRLSRSTPKLFGKMLVRKKKAAVNKVTKINEALAKLSSAELEQLLKELESQT